MAEKLNTELVEQLREKRYREASERLKELEQERLNGIFPTLGMVKNNIKAGDRETMLGLLTVVADSLRNFDVLPQETRESLAGCLQTMESILEESSPRKRGEKLSPAQKRKQEYEEFFTAMAVEYQRRFNGSTLENAKFEVVEKTGLSEPVIKKRWNRQHKAVSDSLEMAYELLRERGLNMSKLLSPKQRGLKRLR